MKKCQTTIVLAALGVLAAAGMRAGEFPDEWTWDNSAQARAHHAALEGKAMPKLEVTGWLNGEVRSGDLPGKVVIIDFYATWCGPCMRAIPHNNELLRKYRDEGLVLIGVCTSSNGQEQMAQVVKDRGIEYPTARDPGVRSEKAWRVQYYPTYAVVDRRGIVRAIGLQPDYVEAVVRKLLAEKT